MVLKNIKKLVPFKFKRNIKEYFGVPSLHWSLENLKRKGFTPDTVFDIGAYEGLWSIDLLEVFPSAKILMVEAQNSKEPFLKAVKEKYKGVDYVISLLSSTEGEIKKFSENETASHVITGTETGGVYKEIKAQSLDALVENKNFPFPDFLKLDVQGHEMEVLKGAEKSLNHATVCLLEISILNLGYDIPLMSEMIAFMDSKGFQAYDISQMIRRPFDKSLYQVDMFFVKKNSYLIADNSW